MTLALAVGACGGNDKTTTPNDSGGKAKTEGKKGGTLTLLLSADFEHIDPARTYTGIALDFNRFILRQLTTYKAVEGSAGNDVVPDLATTIGEPSDGARTWKYTLKDGIKYEDGSPITSKDIKYGVERTFSDQLPEGPAYQRLWLDCPGYKGPYKDPAGCKAIETPDDKTIIFKLNRAVGDFPFLAAFPLFAPVPKAKDTNVNYDNRPFASGPYKIKSYARGKEMTLVRNDQWDAKTDSVRPAYPDMVKVVEGLDPAVIDQRLIGSAGADASAIQLDVSVDPANLAKVQLNPAVKARSAQGPFPFERYLWLNTKKKPMDNVKVRQAMNYLVNKKTYQTARGGPIAGGAIATTIINDTTPGYKKFDLYPAPPEGDVAKAKQLLTEAGYPNGFKVTLATTNKGKGVTQATAVQEGLARGGVKVDILQLDAAVYYNTVGDAAKSPEMGFAAWGPDWPSASTVIPPLLDGRQIQPQGNNALAQYNNDEVNKEMDRISALTDKKEADKAWGDLDERIMKDAPWVPLLYGRIVYLHGDKVKGAYLHAFYGDFDLVSLSVA